MGVKHDGNDGSEVKQEQSQHTSESKNANIEPMQHTQNQKPSMVAKPMLDIERLIREKNPNQVTFGKIL